MGSLKVTLCAGAAAAAVLAPIAPLASAAPAAHPADGGGVSVSPSSPAPGSDVRLRVPDCTEKTAVAVSAAFVSDAKLSPSSSDGALVGAGTVRSTMEAGAYVVRVECGQDAREGTVTVAERQRPAAPASPVAPVDAGGGGTARLAASDTRDEVRPEPPGTAHTVTGLVLAGIAAVAVALRGVRSRSRGTD
ncbi:hypothetical protein ACFFKE_28050 [Streptomyces mutabilis]|uniref:hypothetical protein n=1 Tax=Streptomyces mutabilis TaxID=67332 RepID=UPI001783DFA4|nr:hypothetical protein [Streptomyces mutabilis]GGQ02357.1 hypothetical protein GCM10010279_06940 [Streptomyces mutabilis]